MDQTTRPSRRMTLSNVPVTPLVRFLAPLGISTWILFIGRPLGHALETMRSAEALESGKAAVTVYRVQRENKNLEFRLGGPDLIQVPLQGGGTAQFFADSHTDLQFDGEGAATVARVTWRPFQGLHYGLHVGIGDYEVRTPSGSVTNTLRNDSPGILWGASLGWTLTPDTLVTPGVSVEASYARSQYSMKRLQSGANAWVSVDQLFALDEIQAAVAVSNRWGRLEPSAGLRFFRQTSRLHDRPSAARVKGSRDGYSPFVGLRWEFLPRESLVLEATGADEVLWAAGLSVGF
jgi:hypothetical protein